MEGAPREVGMAHRAGSAPAPLPSFQLNGAHTSACLITLKARARAWGAQRWGQSPGSRIPKPLPPPHTPHPFLICFFQSPATGRAFLPDSAAPSGTHPSAGPRCPFWGQRDGGPRKKPALLSAGHPCSTWTSLSSGTLSTPRPPHTPGHRSRSLLGQREACPNEAAPPSPWLKMRD